jgi:hypothetical protein
MWAYDYVTICGQGSYPSGAKTKAKRHGVYAPFIAQQPDVICYNSLVIIEFCPVDINYDQNITKHVLVLSICFVIL